MFRSLLLLLALGPGIVSPSAAADEPTPAETFDAAWSLYDEHYALFGVKRVDWDAVYRAYRPRIGAEMSRDALFDVLSELGDLLNDVHVSVRDERTGRVSRSGGRSIGSGPFDTGEFSLDLVASAYARDGLEARAGNTLHFGWLAGDIGYLRIARFSYPTSSAQAMDEIVDTFRDARAMIVDVRQNGGGRDSVGKAIAERFADRSRLYMTVENRIPGPDRNAFAAPLEWRLEPGGLATFPGPVVVLTNSRSISAAENFVLAMREIPHALIVGDVTAGAMADTVPVAIAGDWTFTVPVNLMRDRSGTCWEGVGLAPDLWIRNTPEGVGSGTDRVLELALALARPVAE